ncbi:MAG TPA: glycosyltransferase family 39 protein [archaeon]|nr:glycosyltransferase family 39 protein [archaeon]
MVETEIVIDMKKLKFFVLLIFLGVAAFLEMSVTFNSPIAFGDEALHTHLARWIAAHQDYPVYMPQVGTNIFKSGFFRSPEWNILQGSFYFLLGFSETIVKFLVPFIAVLTSLAIYVLVSRLYSQNTAIATSVMTMSVPSFITYSVLLYPEALLVLFISLTFLVTSLAFKRQRRKYIFLAGIFAALSVLTDASGFITIPFFGLAFLYQMFQKRNIIGVIKFWLPAIIIFAVILSPYFFRNIVYYKTPTCQFPNIFSTSNCMLQPDYKPQFTFEGVLSGRTAEYEFFRFGIISYFNFAYGYLFLVPLFAIAGLVLSAYKRETNDILLFVALLVFLLIFYQSVSGRVEDLMRNLVSSTPIVALFAGLYANEIAEFLKRYHREAVWIMIFFVVILSFFNLRNRLETLAGVKQFSPAFLEACNWAKQNLPQDAVLLSFNTAPTVYNCERQAQWDLADGSDILLSQNVELMKVRLNANGFTHIFVQKFSITQQKISGGYWTGFIDALMVSPETFKPIFENGPDYITCGQQGGCDGTAIYEIIY